LGCPASELSPERASFYNLVSFTMAMNIMNIKDPQTEALAAEVAALANETRTQAESQRG